MDDGAAAEILLDGGELPPEPEEADPLADFWARQSGEELIGELQQKERAYFDAASRRGLFANWILAYSQHHGLDPNTMQFETQQITPDGDLGELLMFRINETRSFGRQAIGMTVGSRPAFKCVTTNTDYSSIAQIETADALVTSLYRADMSEQKERDICEGDLIFGYCHGWIQWDSEAGEEVTVPSGEMEPVQMPDGTPTMRPVMVQKRTGMPVGTVIYPWQIALDPKRVRNHDWCKVKEPRSLAEVMAQFPELAEDLRNTKMPRGENSFSAIFAWDQQSATEDDVFVEHFYYRRSRAMPQGRYVGICGDVILWDLPCPVTKGLPIVEMCTARLMCSAFGYADNWDLMSINQAIDQLCSDMLTNYAGFARQTIVADRGTDFDPQALADGRRVLIKDRDAKPPAPVDQAAMPDGVQWALGTYLPARMESVSGLNAAARGNAEGVKSGQHAALLHSIAVELQNPRQAALDHFREQWANLMLDMVRLNAELPLIVEVAGEDERVYAQEFSKKDASGIRRVYVETASPMMRSQAGRMELYDKTKDLPPAEKGPAIMMLSTGQVRFVTNKQRACELRIRWENEKLARGESCPVLALDPPQKHVQEHWAKIEQLSVDPEANAEGIKTLLAHIVEHGYQFRGTDPILAALAGLPPPPPPPQPSQPQPQQPVPPRAAAARPPAPPGRQPPAPRPPRRDGPQAEVAGRTVDEASGVRLPNVPRPSPGSRVVGAAAKAPMTEGTTVDAA